MTDPMSAFQQALEEQNKAAGIDFNTVEQVEPDTTTKQDAETETDATQKTDGDAVVDAETPTETPKPDSEPDSTDNEKAKEKHRSLAAEKRINKLVKEREDAKAEAAYLRGLVDGSNGTKTLPNHQPDAYVDPSLPNPANYTDQIEYQLDLREYKRAEAKKAQELNIKLNEAKVKYPDLEELADLTTAAPLKPITLQLLKESDVPGDIWYYFLTHEDEYEKINSMNAIQAAKAFGKIESKLAEPKEVQKPTPKPSKPAPINPVKTSKATVTTVSKYREY